MRLVAKPSQVNPPAEGVSDGERRFEHLVGPAMILFLEDLHQPKSANGTARSIL